MIQSVKYYNHIKVTDMPQTQGIHIVYTNGEEWDVPKDENNRHYQEIQEWVAKGNTIEESD